MYLRRETRVVWLTNIPCSMLDLLEDFMELRGISYARLDGSVPRPRRNLDIKLVNINSSVDDAVSDRSLLSRVVPTGKVS